jgi:C4-dicarboxylate transporter DctQ subunit
MLPIGIALLLFRFIQATIRIIRGQSDSLIVSHEMEDDVDSARLED